MLYRLLFSLKLAATIFVSSIICSHIITELSSIIHAKHFLFTQIHVAGLQMQFFFKHVMFFTLTWAFIVIPVLIWTKFSSIKFTFTFVIYIMFAFTFTFKSSVLFWTHTLLDKSLRVVYFLTVFFRMYIKKSNLISHFWLLNDTHFIRLNTLTRLGNSRKNIFLLIPKLFCIIFFSLNIYVYVKIVLIAL